MIVQCSQCQTRFRIPDEKVTDRGVKVRCTRCQHTFRVNKQGAMDAAGGDPFGGFGEGTPPPESQATRPGVAHDELAQSRRPQGESTRVMSQAHAAEQLARMEAAADPLPRPPPVTTPQVPRPPPVVATSAPRPPPTGLDPLGVPLPNSGIFEAPTAANPMPGLGDFGADPSDPFANLPLDLPHGMSADPFEALAPAKAPTDPFGSLPGPVNPTLPFGQRSQSAAPAFSPFDDEDFHAAGPMGVDGQTRSELFGHSLDSPGAPMAAPSGRGLLDLPEPSLAQEHIPAPAVAKVTLKVAPAPASAPASALNPIPEAVPREGAGLRGLLVGVSVGLLLLALAAAVALAVMNEGRLSLEGWQGAVSAQGPLETQDVSNGLYTTASGEPIFFVRGEVVNRGAVAQFAEVRVQILDGQTLLREAVARVGAAATPEQLHALHTEADARALREELDRQAVRLEPGAAAPFVVAFVDHPPALVRYRFQITAHPAQPTAAPAEVETDAPESAEPPAAQTP